MKEFRGEWFVEPPQEDGMYLVSCQVVDGGEKFTDVSEFIDGQWEITMPGNERMQDFKVYAWSPYPEPC